MPAKVGILFCFLVNCCLSIKVGHALWYALVHTQGQSTYPPNTGANAETIVIRGYVAFSGLMILFPKAKMDTYGWASNHTSTIPPQCFGLLVNTISTHSCDNIWVSESNMFSIFQDKFILSPLRGNFSFFSNFVMQLNWWLFRRRFSQILGSYGYFLTKIPLYVLKSYFSCSKLQKFAQNITTKRPLQKGESTIVGIGSHVAFKHDSKKLKCCAQKNALKPFHFCQFCNVAEVAIFH